MNNRLLFPLSKHPRWGAVQIAALYLLIGELWILLSDKVAAAIALSQEMLTTISLYKGWAYVLVTASLLYWLIRRHTAELRASQTQLQQVIDALPVLISYVDTDRRYRFTNKTYEEWFGDTARGKTLEEVLGKAAFQTISKQVDRTLAGETVNYESVVSYLQGERSINATYIPDKGVDGQVRGFFALVRDITEEKKAREEIRRWADAFDGCAHGLAIGDPRTNKVVVCNPAFANLHKCSMEDLVGSAILSLYAPEDREQVRHNLEQADQTGRIRYEAHMIRKDGSTFPVQMDVVSVPEDDGKILYRVATAQDITERKQAETALLESSLQFRTLFEASPDAILLIDPHGDWPILDCNTAACRMNGYTHSELIGQPVRILNPDSWSPEQLGGYVDAIRQAGVLHFEALHIRKDGTRFPIEVSASPISLGGQDLLLGIDRDITERKQAEQAQQLERARWQGIVEGIADEVWMCDTQGKMSLLNLAAVTSMGLNPFRDKTVEEVYQEVDIFYADGQPRPPEQAPLLRSLQGKVVRGEEIMRHRQTGKSRYRQFSSAPTRAADGTITGAVAIVRDITDQKIAEEGLRRFELLSEHSRDIILFINREDGRILETNIAAVRTYGYSREELLTLTIQDLRAGNLDLTAAQMAQADAGGILFETVHRCKDGTTFPVEVSSQGVTMGGVRTLISIVRDITERKQAEEKLRKSGERYRYLFENNPHPMWVYDRKTLAFLDVNEAAIAKYGYAREEFLNMTIVDIRPREDVERLMNNLAQPRQPLEHSDGWRHRLKDGTLIHVEITSHTVEIDGHESVLVIAQDVTERKRAERALQESQVRLNFALEKSHTGGWDLDLVDHTALRTLEHDRIFGYESLLPKWTYEIFLDHIIPEDRPEVDRLFQEATAAQTDWSFECRIRRTDDEIRWIWATGGHLFDDRGQAYRMAGIVQDITERKQAEEEIRRLNEHLEQRVIERTGQLQAANKELEAFSYSVSHDLRAPLRAIDGYTRILVEDYEATLDVEGKRVCGIISSEARRMGQLIDDLLAFSRLGRKEMFTSKVDMKALAVSVFNELIKREDQTRIDFQITRLPAVQADPSLLRQVWVNLLSNALKFTSKKEHAIIRVGSKQSAEEYVYYVRDSGAGFDMEYVDKLFGVFQRLHGESEFEGTGVGLAIVQRIIRRHGGRVWAEGEPEKGATFYFALPKANTAGQDE